MARPLRVTVLVLCCVLAGCASPAPVTPPEITFAHLPTISLNVRTIEVTSAYQNATTTPNVETQLKPPPSEVLQRWAKDRLRAVGTTGIARFTVLSAPVTEEVLPKKPGFIGAFTIEPGARYTITLAGQLEILGEAGQRLAVASARVTQSGTLDEGVTPEERQVFWTKLTASAMKSFNEQMEHAIYQYLKNWTA